MNADATDLSLELSEGYVPEFVGQRCLSEPPTPQYGVVQGGRRVQLGGVDRCLPEVVDLCLSTREVLRLSRLLRRKWVKVVIFVMIVIFHLLSLVQSITLDFCYAATGTVDKSATVVHALAWVNLTSADCTGFVARVIFVMIVILKGFPH